MKELYTETSQYRNWRFSKAKLLETREKNHTLAIERVKKKVLEESLLQKQILETLSPAYSEQTENVGSPRVNPSEIEYLTLEDELALCNFYETRIPPMANCFPKEVIENKLTDKVKATAITFVKRFYLRNTVMDYHPKEIIVTCLFLAAKVEHSFVAIEEFTKVVKLPKETIFELEVVVSKSLRYEYTVHHPYLASFGLFLDMQVNFIKDNSKIKFLYEKSLELINKSLYTDCMFIYQPSQISLATLRIAARQDNFDLEKTYLRFKFKSDPKEKVIELYKILDEIESIINSHVNTTVEQAKSIDARLHKCKNPEKNPNSAISKKRRREKEEQEEIDRRKKKKLDDEYQKDISKIFD
ncbi:cyclin-like protein [Gigaspora rosea]|uniref:Cyclin-like protein n=1 Tax=Gigaspora rosea TaxID=44941 RepID=A0A397VW28_9GLOM|nr:cyclin-like protein [Gigaspora rosea]